jgi:alginate O-acetyltransferase complex protein AlgI
MIFATYWFLAFAILFFPIFWLCPKPALRLGLLLVVSAIFHTHYAGPAGVMPIVVMGVIVYLVGLSESRAANALGIILCVLMLVGQIPRIFQRNSARNVPSRPRSRG